MCIKSEFIEICLKLATNDQSDKGFLLTSKVCPQGFSSLAPGRPGAIYMYKIRFRRDHFETCINGHRKQAFLLSSKFFPQWIVCPCPWLCIYIYNETWKKMYIKSDFKALFLNLQQMGKVLRAFGWHQKFVPKGLYALALGLYTYIKSLKRCIKSGFFF